MHYETLLKESPVNYETYYAIMGVKGVKLFDEYGNKNTLDSTQQATLKETMEHYATSFPKVNAH
jgi:hypothetical protein